MSFIRLPKTLSDDGFRLFLLFLMVLASPVCGEPNGGSPVFREDFNKGLGLWTRAAGGGGIAIDNTGGRRYGPGLKISMSSGGGAPFVFHRVAVAGGAKYRLRAWVKGQNSTGDQSSTAMKVEFYNRTGQSLEGKYAHMKLAEKDSSEWQPFDFILDSPPGATQADLFLRVFGPGTVFWDDLEFQQMSEGRAAELAVDPAWVTAGKPVRVKGVLTVQDSVLAGRITQARFVLQDIGAKSPASIEGGVHQRVDQETWCGIFSFTPAKAGRYPVFVELEKQRIAEGVLYVVASPKGGHRKCLDETGTILAGGKPFFPIGLYHVPVLEDEYRKLVAQGFNCVQGKATHDLNEMRADLDLAQRVGLKVDVPLYYGGRVRQNLSHSVEKIKTFKDHPAVICWKISDEPDAHGAYLRDEIFETFHTLRSIDRDALLEITLNGAGAGNFYTPLCEIVQVDPYPIPHHPLEMVHRIVSQARAGLPQWKGLIATLQCGWTRDMSTQPSYSQARTMVYMAVIGGAKGIFWYSYTDPDWNLSRTPLWKDFKKLNEETALLGNIAINGLPEDRIKVVPSSTEILRKIWKYGGKGYVAIVNSGRQNTTVTVTVPSGSKRVTAYSGAKIKNDNPSFSCALEPDRAELIVIACE